MERHHQLKDIILLRYQYYPKWPIESMLIPIKIPMISLHKYKNPS